MRLSSFGLIAGKVATMGTGALFWLLAAKEFARDDVGLAGAVIPAMMLCTQLALLGIGSAFIVDYPKHERRPASLLDTALSMVVATSLVAAGIFLASAALFLDKLDVVASTPLYAALFVAMTITGTIQILFDQVSMALRRGDQVFLRAVLFGALTFGSLGVVVLFSKSASSMAIVSPWVVGGAGLCLLGLVQLWHLCGRYNYRPRIDRAIASRMVRVGVPNHLLTLTERAPGLILPIIVVEQLSKSANATWYVVWMMTWVIYIVPISVGIALFSELIRKPEAYGRAVRHGAQTAMAFGAAGAILLALLANVLLGFFGHAYADEGTAPLRILVWGFVPLTVIQVYYASCRARHRLGEAIVAGVLAGLVSLAAAYVVAPDHGLTGMAVAWIVTQALAGLWAAWRVRAMSRASGPRPEGNSARATEALREAVGESVAEIAPSQPAP
jgi:O-antigen/teichoic acid export membrane protein